MEVCTCNSISVGREEVEDEYTAVRLATGREEVEASITVGREVAEDDKVYENE